MTLGWYFKNIFADSVLVSGLNNHQDKLWDSFETDLVSASELVQTVGVLTLDAITDYARNNYLEKDEILVNTMVNIA